MNLTDYLFVPALLVTCLIYYLTPKKARWLILLIVSLLFFYSWSSWQIVYLITAVFAAWGIGLWLQKRNDITTETVEKTVWPGRLERLAYQKARKKGSRLVLLIGLILLIGTLVLSKLKNVIHVSSLSLIAPLGISYYTMSLVGYMADVYWKKETAEKNPLRLLLFAAYFPRIIEGPIIKHRDTGAQFQCDNAFNYRRFCYGLQRMAWGYIKKLVIADRISLLTDTVFASYTDYHGGVLLVSLILAVFELYCDFSGYMDIALGASELFGIKLDENFNHPFFAKSAAEFWRRWHMTLSGWFKDYVYMPIVVSPRVIKITGMIRKKFGRRAGQIVSTSIPLCIVWLLTGLWHGTGIHYIVWGLYWGMLMILGNILAPVFSWLNRKLKINPKRKLWVSWQMIRTFLLFLISRLIVLPESLKTSWEILKRILFSLAPWELFDGTMLTLGLSGAQWVLLGVMLYILLEVSVKQEQGIVFRDRIAALPLVIRWMIYFAVIFFILIFGVYGAEYDASSFIYMIY